MPRERESAGELAIEALAWIAGRDDLRAAFLAASGAVPGDVARRAADPDFQAAVLDFLLSNDPWVIAFAASADLPPDRILRARRHLPGTAPDWT
jgi:hypothetical protein